MVDLGNAGRAEQWGLTSDRASRWSGARGKGADGVAPGVAARRALVQPVLDAFHRWLQDKRDQVLPGSALGKAVAFALGEWPKLIRYLEHPQLRPDNNACEQAIRPFVVRRKNWLFSEARAETRRAQRCTA